MAVELSALPVTNRDLVGEGLTLAGSGFSLKKAMRTAGRVADVGLPILAATNPELAPEIGAAMAVRQAMSGSGMMHGGGMMQGGKLGKGTQRKVLKAAKKGAVVADKLISEFGSDKQKKQAAKAKRVAEIVSGSGHGKPGAALRARVMAHNYS